MKRIGITGGNGIIGQTLQKKFNHLEWTGFQGEILNSSEINAWLEKAGDLDAVIHLAAVTPTHQVNENPTQALRVNAEGTCRLLEAIGKTRKNAPNSLWIFLASTCHVYASSNQPLTETSPLDPISLYGLTKLQSEQWAQALQKTYGFQLCIGRIFSTSSPQQPPTYFLPAMIKKISTASKGSTLSIRGLLGTRDFTTPEQVSHVIYFLMKNQSTGIFNIASGSPIKLLDLVKKIQKLLKREDLIINPLDQETYHLIANVEKLRKLGFETQQDLDILIKNLL